MASIPVVGPKVQIGLTTIISWAVALAALVPLVAKAVQEGEGISVSGPERWLLLAGVGLAALTAIFRSLQSAAGISVAVKAGITTILTYVVGLAGLIPVLLTSYGEGARALAGPEKYAALAGVVLLGVMTVGRYLQSLPIFSSTRAAIVNQTVTRERVGV